MRYIKKQLFTLFFLFSISIVGQNYNIADVDFIEVCEGVFTDSNAASNGNNYLNNENHSITICPTMTMDTSHVILTVDINHPIIITIIIIIMMMMMVVVEAMLLVII